MSVKPAESKSTDLGTEEALNVQTERLNKDERKKLKDKIWLKPHVLGQSGAFSEWQTRPDTLATSPWVCYFRVTRLRDTGKHAIIFENTENCSAINTFFSIIIILFNFCGILKLDKITSRLREGV